MSEANNHEPDGPTQYPRPLEGLKPEIPSLTELTAQPKGRQRWAKPAEIAMTLLFAVGVAYFGWKMNNQDQATKEANFGLARATAQTEVNQVSARATEFTAIVIPTATPEPTATAEPSPTEKPTVEPTKAASPTPEAPKVVYKNITEINQKLKEEASKGNFMVIDVWSAQGVKVEETGSTAQFDTLAFNGYKPGDIFISPIVGKVDYVAIGQLRGGNMLKNINIITEGIESLIVVGTKDEVLVKDGDDIIPGTPLAKLTGELLPVNSGMYKNGLPYRCQIDLVAGIDQKAGEKVFGKNSILKENGMVINIAPQGGK